MYNQIKTRFLSLLLAFVTVFSLIPGFSALAAENLDVTITQDSLLRSGNIIYGV